MLEWQIGLCRMDREFRARGWAGRMPGSAPAHRELRGLTLGIVGHGHIGREAASRARAFGMRCIGIRRRAAPCPPELDWLGQADRLDALLAESDFVLIACDLNAETLGLIDAGRLAAMKPTGVLINIARGRIVDEDALWEALSGRRIGGAVLDVWYNYNQPGEPEVRPANHPFESLDNVILSAHQSAVTEEMHARRWRFVARNCARIERGEPPENVVFTGTGC
jgi:phosphoglycerate dehydrogenase-like enzyme